MIVADIVKKKIKPGALVMVTFPLMRDAEQTNNPARKLEGEEFTVKRRVNVNTRSGVKGYWELWGAVSDKGVPYGFLDEELYVIAEVNRWH